jgi:hypothetical protein
VDRTLALPVDSGPYTPPLRREPSGARIRNRRRIHDAFEVELAIGYQRKKYDSWLTRESTQRCPIRKCNISAVENPAGAPIVFMTNDFLHFESVTRTLR